MKKRVLIPVCLTIFGLICSSGCIDIVNYRSFNATYKNPLNLNRVLEELQNNSVSIIYTENLDDAEIGLIACAFGKSYNDVELDDTCCYIRGYRVLIRLYKDDKDEIDSNFDKYNSSLEKSMIYIENIIFNATGEQPFEKYFKDHDGDPCPKP